MENIKETIQIQASELNATCRFLHHKSLLLSISLLGGADYNVEPEYLPLLNFDIGKKLSFSRCRVCDIPTKDLQKGVKYMYKLSIIPLRLVLRRQSYGTKSKQYIFDKKHVLHNIVSNDFNIFYYNTVQKDSAQILKT